MSRILLRCLGLSLLLPTLGFAQDGDAKFEEVLQGLLGNLKQITKTLESVTDEATGEAARPELKKQAEEFKATRKKSEELAPPVQETRDRISKKYQPEFEKARKELIAQMARVQRVPGGKGALQEIRSVLEKGAP